MKGQQTLECGRAGDDGHQSRLCARRNRDRDESSRLRARCNWIRVVAEVNLRRAAESLPQDSDLAAYLAYGELGTTERRRIDIQAVEHAVLIGAAIFSYSIKGSQRV